MPTTSAANLEDCLNCYRGILSQGQDLLYVAFSSGLSSTYATATVAAQQIMEEFPEPEGPGGGLPVRLSGAWAAGPSGGELRSQGCSLEETANALEAQKLQIVHNFTVDDLNHLHRGGRVSKATAVVGTLINIKPVLHVDNEGHLTAVGKARGRKASILDLVKRMEAQIQGFENPKSLSPTATAGGRGVSSPAGAGEIRHSGHSRWLYGPTIGSHSGPGTLALFFKGSPR